VAETALVADDIQMGRRAAEAFDSFGPEARALFWFYMVEAGEWRLVVATPVVDEAGPKAAYTQIAKTLDREGIADELPLRRVSAMGADDPLVALLRKGIRTGPGISGIRFSNNVINGVHIDDAYIYRMQ